MAQITINNPTQLSFKHDNFRAENVTIIPTPNNSSNLATMINDTTYYDISNDSECRYKKVITPKTNVERTNYYRENGGPVGAKVCHYTKNNEDHYVVNETENLVNFNNGNVMFQNSTISDDEIFFKDSENNQIKLDVVNSTSGIELENRSTMTSFSFNVPSFVSKVEIEHKMDASLQNAPDKAKIHIDLDDGKNTYYIAEKRDTINDQTSVTVFTNIYGKELRNVMTTAGESNEFLKVDLGNGYIYFCNAGGGYIYRAYWDNKVGDTEHIYSFTNAEGEYAIQSFDSSLSDYTFLMKLSDFKKNHPDITGRQLSTLEDTQNTSLYFHDMIQGVEAKDLEYYTRNKSNYPGLYTFCKELFSSENETVGYFFLTGTNHIFKINVQVTDKIDNPHTLNSDDINSGLEVFTGGTFTKEDLTIDDTYTSQLNFGTLCDELAKVITSQNILSGSNTESSTNN